MAAFLDTPTAARRRRAFFSALAPLASRDIALEAINMWEQTFGSDQPLLRGVSQFAELVVKELGLPITAPDLAVLLLKNLQKDEAHLPPDPITLLTGRRAAAAPASANAVRPSSAPPPAATRTNVSPVVRTLSQLLLKLCDHAGHADARSQAALVRGFINQCASQLSRNVAHDVTSLLSGRSTLLQLDYDQKLGSLLINTFYVQLAELYGPVSADRIVTRAVQATQDQLEARGFPPRDLL